MLATAIANGACCASSPHACCIWHVAPAGAAAHELPGSQRPANVPSVATHTASVPSSLASAPYIEQSLPLGGPNTSIAFARSTAQNRQPMLLLCAAASRHEALI